MSNNLYTVRINSTEHGTRTVELYANKAITSQSEAENHVFKQYQKTSWQVAFTGKATAPGRAVLLGFAS